MKEIRILSNSVSIRSDDENGSIIEGYASVFNSESNLIAEGGKVFKEIIKPGAFDDVLSSGDLNVVANRDHDNKKMLARTKSRTLTLSVDDYGLKFMFEAPKTTLGKDTVEMIKRGDLNECSFKYSVRESDIKWYRGNDGILRREILKIYRLFDVSMVVDGAFSMTPVYVDRGLTELEEQEEIKRKQELDAYYKSLKERIYGGNS